MFAWLMKMPSLQPMKVTFTLTVLVYKTYEYTVIKCGYFCWNKVYSLFRTAHLKRYEAVLTSVSYSEMTHGRDMTALPTGHIQRLFWCLSDSHIVYKQTSFSGWLNGDGHIATSDTKGRNYSSWILRKKRLLFTAGDSMKRERERQRSESGRLHLTPLCEALIGSWQKQNVLSSGPSLLWFARFSQTDCTTIFRF